MKNIKLLISSMIDEDVLGMKTDVIEAENIYNERRRTYDESLKTRDSVKINNEFQLYKAAESSLSYVRSKLADVLSELEKTMPKPADTNVDLSTLSKAELEAMVKEATRVYQEHYNAQNSQSSGAVSSAMSSLTLALEKANLDNLKNTLARLYPVINETASTAQTNTKKSKTTTKTENSMPWMPIGAGALAVIAVILLAD